MSIIIVVTYSLEVNTSIIIVAAKEQHRDENEEDLNKIE